MYSIDESMVREVLLRTSKTPASASPKKQNGYCIVTVEFGLRTSKGDHGNHGIH